MASVTAKWVCPACSCHNNSSASRCTVCTSVRPADLLSVPAIRPRLKNIGTGAVVSSMASGAGVTSSDMIIDPGYTSRYRPTSIPLSIAGSSGSQGREGRGEMGGGGSGVSSSGGGGAQSKWICSVCTYGNWPNSRHCTMCNSLRRHPQLSPQVSGEAGLAKRAVSGGGSGSVGMGGRGAGIGESILDYVPRHVDFVTSPGAVGGGLYDETIRSPSAQLASPTNHRVVVRVKKKSATDNNRSAQKKWKCSKCTYENWARAGKCVMCQSTKSKTPSPPMSDSESCHSPHPVSHRLPSSPSAENANSSATPPLSSSSTTSPSLHGRGSLAVNSNNQSSPSVSPSLAGPSPSAVHLIPCSTANTPPDVLPPSSLKSTSNEVRQIRNCLSSSDWLFINACLGVVNEDVPAIKAYLRSEGDRARQLSCDECLVLGQPSIFSIGSTLVHLAIRYQRSDILSLLLTPAPSEARKRLPSQSNPDLATSIREEVGLCLKQHKGQWPCYFFTHLCTFSLPTDIRRLYAPVKKRALDGIVDREVEKELEEGTPIINWSSELVDEMGCYLYPLWNRTAGDCLLDSVLQATWGVMDRDGTLRRALADSIIDGASLFYKRWKEEEQRQAHLQGYSLGEEQLRQDWAAVLALADQKRKSLEQIHVFALAHILRRPIVVYGVKVVKNFRGENLGFVNFEGLYLPLVWESKFCSKSPVALAYTRGHFSALVSLPSPDTNEVGAWSNRSCDSHVTYLPLVDSEGRQLPIHFISEEEIGCEERLLKQYCECHVTRTGILTAVQEAGCPHSLVSQLVDEWLDRYRRMDKRREAAACSNYDSDS